MMLSVIIAIILVGVLILYMMGVFGQINLKEFSNEYRNATPYRNALTTKEADGYVIRATPIPNSTLAEVELETEEGNVPVVIDQNLLEPENKLEALVNPTSRWKIVDSPETLALSRATEDALQSAMEKEMYKELYEQAIRDPITAIERLSKHIGRIKTYSASSYIPHLGEGLEAQPPILGGETNE